MAQIDHVDWVNKRFYLHADTVTNGFDAWEAFAEVRQLVAANAANEQGFGLFIHRQGKVPKDLAGTRFTPRYVTFSSGWRGVPSNTPHQLLVSVEMLNPLDGVSDRGMFDRSLIAAPVDIDAAYSQVEVITVSGSGGGSSYTGLTPAELQAIADAVWAKMLP